MDHRGSDAEGLSPGENPHALALHTVQSRTVTPVVTDSDNNGAAGPVTSEGGTQAWLTVVGSSLVYFATFGFINSFGFFQNYYQSYLLQTYPPAVIALIGTVQIALMYLVGPIAGSLFDSYGLTVRAALTTRPTWLCD